MQGRAHARRNSTSQEKPKMKIPHPNMKLRGAVAIALLVFCAVALSGQTGKRQNSAPSFKPFWTAFKEALAKNDKEAVADMTRFPLQMPYGVRSVAGKAAFIKGYGKIFDAETKKCFATAEPQLESGKVKGYTVSCGEAMLYWFEAVNGSYKFTRVDNVNE